MPADRRVRVIVVGAGVVGLSCAVRLLEAGHDVAVLARDLPLETTSSGGGGALVPLPGAAAGPGGGVGGDDVRRARRAGRRARHGRAGARRDRGVPRSRSPTRGGPPPCPTCAATRDLPAPYVDGWSFAAPVVEMPVYLAWLARRVVDLGGSVTRLALAGAAGRAATSSSTAPGSGRAGWPADPTVRAGAGPGGRGRAGRDRPLVARRRRTDVRRARARATSSSAAPTTRASGAGPPRRR